MKSTPIFIFILWSSLLFAQQFELELSTDPYLFRETGSSYTYSPHDVQTEKPIIEGDTTGLFLSLFENLSTAPLLRITKPGMLKGYPTIISVEESGDSHYFLLQRTIRIPCNSDPSDTEYYLVERRDKLDSTLMNQVFRLSRIAINKDGQVKETAGIPSRSEFPYFITVIEESGNYLTVEVLRKSSTIKNDRLNHFINLSDDFLRYTNDFNARRHSDYVNEILFLIREYETGIPSPTFH